MAPVRERGRPNIDMGLSKTTPVEVLVSGSGQSLDSSGNPTWSTERLLGVLPMNTWVDFTVGMTWSSNPALGHLIVKMNGVQVVSMAAAAFYAGMSAYLKQGIYRMASPQTQTIFHTATKIGTTETIASPRPNHP